MPERCFYCSDELEERNVHYVSFVSDTEERDEILCHDCYHEWLHGMKG